MAKTLKDYLLDGHIERNQMFTLPEANSFIPTGIYTVDNIMIREDGKILLEVVDGNNLLRCYFEVGNHLNDKELTKLEFANPLKPLKKF